MPDYFNRLQVPLTPFLDDEVLKKNYLQLSAESHPDRQSEEPKQAPAALDASSINEAYQQLSKMSTRLRHLLEMVTGQAPESLKQVPSKVGDRFMEVGGLLREADALLKEKPREDASELAKVVFLKKSLPMKGKLEALQSKLRQDEVSLMTRLSVYQDEWEQNKAALPAEWMNDITMIYHEWTFLDKWRQQISARLLESMV